MITTAEVYELASKTPFFDRFQARIRENKERHQAFLENIIDRDFKLKDSNTVNTIINDHTPLDALPGIFYYERLENFEGLCKEISGVLLIPYDENNTDYNAMMLTSVTTNCKYPLSTEITDKAFIKINPLILIIKDAHGTSYEYNSRDTYYFK